MKQLNFTAKEILPSLLDKSKTQTICKAWIEKELTDEQSKTYIKGLQQGTSISFKGELTEEGKEIFKPFLEGSPKNVTLMFKKPPKFKVGDEVELVWDRDSKYWWFDKETGKGVNMDYFPNAIVFHTELCKVTITEVFEIEISKTKRGTFESYHLKKLYVRPDFQEGAEAEKLVDKFYFDNGLKNNTFEEIWKKDGFKSTEEMFAYFDKNYDLSLPKRFFVYRWRWLK